MSDQWKIRLTPSQVKVLVEFIGLEDEEAVKFVVNIAVEEGIPKDFLQKTVLKVIERIKDANS